MMPLLAKRIRTLEKGMPIRCMTYAHKSIELLL